MRLTHPSDYEYIRIRVQRGARTGGPNTTLSFSIKQWRRWMKCVPDPMLRDLVKRVGLQLLAAENPPKPLSKAVVARVDEVLKSRGLL